MKQNDLDLYNIPKPHEWNGEFWAINNQILTLRLYKPYKNKGGSLWLHFQEVLHFKLPIMWKGVKFKRGSSVDCLLMTRSMQRYNVREMPSSKIVERYNLYIIVQNNDEREENNLHILGSQVSIINKLKWNLS